MRIFFYIHITKKILVTCRSDQRSVYDGSDDLLGVVYDVVRRVTVAIKHMSIQNIVQLITNSCIIGIFELVENNETTS